MRNIAKYRPYLPLALFVVVLAVAAMLLHGAFDGIVARLAAYEESNPVLGVVLFVLLAAASVLLGPFSSAPLIPFAVEVWGTGKTLVMLMAGWAVGNAAAYGIGYVFGHPIVDRLVPRGELRKWMAFLRDEVDAKLIFLFRLAVPAEIGYAFGILKYDLWKYLAIVILAEVPFALLLVFGGEAFLDRQWLSLAAFVAAAIITMAVAYALFRRARKR